MKKAKNNLLSRTLVLFFVFVSYISFSQDLTFTGYTKFEEVALSDVKIKAMLGSKVVAETTSGKNGFFSFHLDYNSNYSIYFEKENYIPMHADVAGAVPENKTV